MKNLQIILILSIFLSTLNYAQQKNNFKGVTINFASKDGLTITADKYLISNTEAPFIILFHQAGYSRGEYLEIAPKLNELGFNCIAIDQRSGNKVNGVTNETNKEADKLNKSTKYIDAIPDIEAAFLYVKNKMNAKKIIVWGSSYSAALMFYLASRHVDGIDAVLSFSPGEYFKIDGETIKSFAKRTNCPVFITSAKNEHDQWKGIYDSVTGDKNYFLPELSGKHGSKALWADNEDHKEYWNAVQKFLNTMKK
jgi:dienelactone hydrolase